MQQEIKNNNEIRLPQANVEIRNRLKALKKTSLDQGARPSKVG